MASVHSVNEMKITGESKNNKVYIDHIEFKGIIIDKINPKHVIATANEIKNAAPVSQKITRKPNLCHISRKSAHVDIGFISPFDSIASIAISLSSGIIFIGKLLS
jgi:hypothetical protein